MATGPTPGHRAPRSMGHAPNRDEVSGLGQGETVLRDLSEANLQPVYFLYGDNVWLRDQLVLKLRELAVPAAWRSMNAETLWADDVTEVAATEAASTPPFGSARRFLVVRGVEAYRGGRVAATTAGSLERPRSKRRPRANTPESSPLLAYLASPAPAMVLVLVSERWEAARWEGDALYAAAARVGMAVQCARPTGGARLRWLAEQARALGVTLEPPAAHELLDRIGEDTYALCRELEKLACYSAPEKPIAVQSVLALTSELAPPSVFHFLDALFVERRPDRALSLLGRLLTEMHPLQLHAMLLTQLRKMIALKGALGEGLTPGAIAARVKLPFSLVSQLGLMARRTSPGRFAELLRSLASAEARLKRGREGRAVLEGLVLECCR